MSSERGETIFVKTTNDKLVSQLVGVQISFFFCDHEFHSKDEFYFAK